MHPKYQDFINTRYLNSPKTTVRHMREIFRQFPPPEELTREWIVSFISKSKSQHSRWTYYYRIRVVLEHLGLLHLLDGIKVSKPKTKVKRSDLLKPNEISSLLRACKNIEERATIEFLLESGCRVGEMLNMELEDITIEENFLLVSLTGKTGHREVPLLKSHLQSFLLHIAFIDSGKVFPYAYTTILHRIQRLYTKAGVTKRDRTTHIFRHTKATHLMEQGVPEAIIKRFLGWSDRSTIIQSYLHLSSKTVKDYFARYYGISSTPLEPLYPDEERERIKEIMR